MELNFSELDNSYTQNPYHQNINESSKQLNNPDKYWENYQEPNKTQQVKKKKVSFDDILSNMNLVVNKSGVLQFMQPMQNDEYYPQQKQYQQQQNQYQYPQNQYPQQQKQYPQNQYPQKQQPYQEYVAQQIAKRPQIQNKNQNIKKINQNQPPIDPALKNSFLYNKYFKDYKEASTNEPEVRVPKNIQEYRRMLIEDKIKKLQQKKRIADIKSTKLLFTANNNTNNQNDIRVSKNNNHLRSMSFH